MDTTERERETESEIEREREREKITGSYNFHDENKIINNGIWNHSGKK